MHSFEYLEPTTVADAARLLAEYGHRARLLAGGTDLLIQMEGGRHQPEAVIYTGRIPELRRITGDAAQGLRIGAMATLREVENHPVVMERYPALARGAKEVGSVQIRNLATLAGNLCNASPSADTSTSLLCLDAAVRIAGTGGERTVPVGEFWKGPGRTDLKPDEMVTGVLLPTPAAGTRSFYYKLAVRKAMDLAMVGVAVSLVRQNGSAKDVRIALGAVAPVVIRATDAERLVASGPVEPSRLEEAARLAMEAAKPISDQRASAEYRREMVRALTHRGLKQCLSA
jgi:CO/xanthine dehydrogenase FAD-binding subunit